MGIDRALCSDPLKQLVLPLLLWSSIASADESTDVLVLSEPTVLMLYAPEAEQAGYRSDPHFSEFSDDFNFYSGRIGNAVTHVAGVRFLTSTVGEIEFGGDEHDPILRASLGGFGYIVHVPKHPPAIFRGVATDPDILCALQERSVDIAPQSCQN